MGALFGHKFESVFTTQTYNDQSPIANLVTKPDFNQWTELVIDGIESDSDVGPSIADLFRNSSNENEIYHGDVCCRCGLVVNKPMQLNQEKNE